MLRKWAERYLAVLPAVGQLALLPGRVPGRDAARQAVCPAPPLPPGAGPRVPLRCKSVLPGVGRVHGQICN